MRSPRPTSPVPAGRRVAGSRGRAHGPAGRAVHGTRVLTWNLWWRFGDWRARHEAVVEVLARARPDVLCLQEVWVGEGRGQVDLLAEALGMSGVTAPVPDARRWQRRLGDDRFGIANAVLSRWPITAHETLVLPGGPGERTALHALVAAPGGPVPVFTTQLESAPAASAARCAQVAALVPFVARHSGHAHPPVLTGDLNAEPDSDELRLLGGHRTAPVVPGAVLVDAWRWADPRDPGWTWDARNPHVAATFEPSARIDYVLLGPPGVTGTGAVRRVALVGDRPVRGVWPSDHAGVLAELEP